MKKIFFLLFMAVSCAANAQYDGGNSRGSIHAGLAYVYDFPGMNGQAAYTEYSFPLNDFLQGGVGLKRIRMAGYPRTQTVREYTKATTIDFSLLFVPVHAEKSAVRIGAGYSFSFYKIRRSYPIYTSSHADPAVKEVSWPQSDSKGRVHGVSVIGEYEYYISNQFSAGARMSVSKAYDNVVMAGLFMAAKL